MKDPQRGTGRTTRQMLAAPLSAHFIWHNNELSVPKELARFLGREDLRIVGPSWLDNCRGLRPTGVVLDHWAKLDERRACIYRLMADACSMASVGTHS